MQCGFCRWRSLVRSRGDMKRRLVERCVMQWRLVVHKRRTLLLAQRKAKQVVRTLRIRAVLEGGLSRITLTRISDAAETGLWLRTEQKNAALAVSSRIDALLHDAEARSGAILKREESEPTRICESPKQLRINGKLLTLSQRELEGLRCLKEVSLLLSASESHDIESILKPMFRPRPPSANLSPLGLIRKHVADAGISILAEGEVHVMKLIQLADSFEPIRKRHETSDAFADYTLLLEEPDDCPDALRTTDDRDDGLSVPLLEDDHDEFLEAVSSLAALGTGEDSGKSFVEAVAETTRANLSDIKIDIDRSLEQVQSSETHLVDYKDYIEKKKRQRSQCLRDLKMHCCACQGPHIAKPPFSIGKDYRREPTHAIHKGKNCLFLKKKRQELRWLDETLAKYSANNKRFERELARLSRETDRKRNDLQQALRNSFLLMEMASS